MCFDCVSALNYATHFVCEFLLAFFQQIFAIFSLLTQPPDGVTVCTLEQILGGNRGVGTGTGAGAGTGNVCEFA